MKNVLVRDLQKDDVFALEVSLKNRKSFEFRKYENGFIICTERNTYEQKKIKKSLNLQVILLKRNDIAV